MKTCTKCKVEKALDAFRTRYGKPWSWCKSCENADCSARNKTYDQENMRAYHRARTSKLRTWVAEIKESMPCTDCQLYWPSYVMQWDHIPGTNKVRDVSKLCGQGASRKRIQEEIDKCELVCANCHAIRTHR